VKPDRILITISRQVLGVECEGVTLHDFPVSTSRHGPGERSGSFCTPMGAHIIRAKIGAGMAPNTVFQGRRPTGEIYGEQLGRMQPDRDWILTRIIWLSGLEIGANRLGDVDTMRRYIYIHGTPDSEPMQIPMSHGCIRMRNRDVIELFDMVEIGTAVDIVS
jgi:L,D-transpeptidase YbiS